MGDERGNGEETADPLLAPAGGRHGEYRSLLQAREEFFHRFDCGGRVRHRYEQHIASAGESPSGEKRKQKRRRSKGTPQLCSSVLSDIRRPSSCVDGSSVSDELELRRAATIWGFRWPYTSVGLQTVHN